jgi:hypothetical protein
MSMRIRSMGRPLSTASMAFSPLPTLITFLFELHALTEPDQCFILNEENSLSARHKLSLVRC